MSLLTKEHFAEVFEPLRGQRVSLIDGRGNAGDEIIHAATRQLLREFGVNWTTVNPFWDYIDTEVILIFGGGSMGGPWPHATALRVSALNTGIPCIVLPQSFIKAEDMPYEKVFVREKASLSYCPNGILAPDLALGYQFPEVQPAKYEKGLFLRMWHSAFPALPKVDPCVHCHTAGQYIHFAANYQHIVTDRLHLAITMLGIGRRVTLLPSDYHKNRSMWETWLKDLGCEWANRPEQAA